MAIEQTLETPSAQDATAENITDEQLQELSQEASFTDDTNSGTNEVPTERPEWLQEQFKTPEDLAKAYSDLRAKMDSGDSTKEPTKEDSETTGGDPEESNTAEEANAATTKSENVASAFSEYSEKGELSEDTYKSLEKEGFDKGLVDAYIAGQAALQASSEIELKAAAGGNPELLLEWGNQNLTADQLTVHNKAMEGTVGEAKAAIELLRFQFERDQGNRGEFHGKGSQGQVADSQGKLTFFNQEDIVKAMNNPDYDTSETYRQKVEDGIARMFK